MAGMVAKSVAALGQGHNRKMVCSLTGSHLEQGVAVNLAASRRFVTRYGNNLNSSKAPTIPPNASRKFCIC